MHRFDRDTAVTELEEPPGAAGDAPESAGAEGGPAGQGRKPAPEARAFAGRIDRGWWIVKGPNGGYVAAILLRAMQAAAGDAERAPRSLTVHFTAPPAEGPVRIETRLERAGRSLSTVSARMLQEGRRVALALGAFSRPREALEVHSAPMPEAPPPERCPSLEALGPAAPAGMTLRERLESRYVFGPDPAAAGGTAPAAEARSGGWIRLAEGARPLDAPLATLFCDAWPPAVFSWVAPERLSSGVPTVDLTVHFRGRLPPPGMGAGELVLAAFRSREAREGFVEEEGELWSREGLLLAQSRQLAVIG